MSLLCDRAPTAVEISGREYPVRWSFRTGLRFERLIRDGCIPERQKMALAYHLYYPEYPEDVQAGLEKILWFWGCGRAPRQKTGAQGGKAAYDFEQDAPLIYAAFMADYGIDLEAVEGLHWWKFCALLAALRPENLFCRVVEARNADLAKMQGEQRAYYRRLKTLYALEENGKADEKARDIVEALAGNGDVGSVLQRLDGG